MDNIKVCLIGDKKRMTCEMADTPDQAKAAAKRLVRDAEAAGSRRR